MIPLYTLPKNFSADILLETVEKFFSRYSVRDKGQKIYEPQKFYQELFNRRGGAGGLGRRRNFLLRQSPRIRTTAKRLAPGKNFELAALF